MDRPRARVLPFRRPTRASRMNSTLLLAQAGTPIPGTGLSEAFGRTGPMAQFVLGLLFFFSVVSWAIFLWKVLHLARARRQSRKFLETFRASKRFSEVSAVAARLPTSPLVGIFQAGYAEVEGQIRGQHEGGAEGAGRMKLRSLTGVERTLRRAVAGEFHSLSRGASFLATTAAACPFIGLFGTVWGIMGAFAQIGTSGTTSLVAVAPGISEALINTAAGLGAAIPALIGYNYLGGRFRGQRSQMEDFALEFLNLAERNFT